MNNVYLVFPPVGYGSNDMVIVAETAEEAKEMFYKEAGMTGDHYKEARESGCIVARIKTNKKQIAYERWDNL